jgi:hypothetical protein
VLAGRRRLRSPEAAGRSFLAADYRLGTELTLAVIGIAAAQCEGCRRAAPTRRPLRCAKSQAVEPRLAWSRRSPDTWP